jgi:hypothetical protein
MRWNGWITTVYIKEIKDKLENGLITTIYSPSGHQLEDVLTKRLPT